MFSTNSTLNKICSGLNRAQPDLTDLTNSFIKERGHPGAFKLDFVFDAYSEIFLRQYLKSKADSLNPFEALLKKECEKARKKGRRKMPTSVHRQQFEFSYGKGYWLFKKNNKEYCKVRNIGFIQNLPVGFEIKLSKRGLKSTMQKADRIEEALKILYNVTEDDYKIKAGYVIAVPKNLYNPADDNQGRFRRKGAILVPLSFTDYEFKGVIAKEYKQSRALSES